MNKQTILAVPLLAASILFEYGNTSAAPIQPPDDYSGRQDQRGEMMQPRATQQPPRLPSTPPQPQSQPSPVHPVPSESQYWMPKQYDMPMHYRMLEPEMIYGYQLMSQKERIDYMNRIHRAKTFEERDRLRMEHHRIMQDRARKRHLTLPDMPRDGRGGPGPGPKR